MTQAAPPAARSAVAGATSRRPEAGPTRSSEVDSRPGPAVFYRLRDPRPGSFDRASGSYRDNLVVSATRVPEGKGVAR